MNEIEELKKIIFNITGCNPETIIECKDIKELAIKVRANNYINMINMVSESINKVNSDKKLDDVDKIELLSTIIINGIIVNEDDIRSVDINKTKEFKELLEKASSIFGSILGKIDSKIDSLINKIEKENTSNHDDGLESKTKEELIAILRNK